MTTIALLRHGQTQLHVERRWQGSTDAPLNEVGCGQAEAAAGLLRLSGPWTRVVTSPLRRASETAAIVAAHLELPEPVEHAGLVEQHGGAAEALLMSDVTLCWPDEDTIPDVETRERVAQRGADALTELAGRHLGENLVVVAHGTFIGVTVRRLTGETAPHLPNGHFVALRYDRPSKIWTLLPGPNQAVGRGC